MSRPLERLTALTLLGLRFWDPVVDRQVSDDLEVTAYPETAPQLATPAARTPSGVYAFQGLPGLEEIEYPLIEPPPGALFGAPPANPPALRRFWIKVHDQRRRFSPLRFAVALPLPYRGVYRPAANGSPPEESPARVYLFSSPSRQPAPGVAVVRASLEERFSQRPAAFALLEVDIAGQRWYGIADKRGSVAVFLPYPTFIAEIGGSPPGSPPVVSPPASPPEPPAGPPPAEQSWPLTARIRYNPALADDLAGDEEEIPTLGQIRNQPFVSFWPAADEPESDAAGWELNFGQELILRTDDRSVLWLRP